MTTTNAGTSASVASALPWWMWEWESAMERMGVPPVQNLISCHQGIKGVEGGSRRRSGHGRLFATTVVSKCRRQRWSGSYDVLTLSHQAVQLGDEGTSGSSLLAGTSSLLVEAALSVTGSLPTGAGCMLVKEQLKLFVAGNRRHAPWSGADAARGEGGGPRCARRQRQ